MKSLFELRKEAQALGIENYAAMSKEALAKVIEEHQLGGSKVQEIEPEEELTEEEAKIIAEAEAAEEKEEEKMKALRPEERLAARKAKLAAEKAEQEAAKKEKKMTKAEAAKIAKAEKARQIAEEKAKRAAEKEAKKAEREAEKAAKKAELAASKTADKKPRVDRTNKLLDLIPNGEKPVFRAGKGSAIYDELLKNDGRTYSQIAKDVDSHYNMVRKIAETYFSPSLKEAVIELASTISDEEEMVSVSTENQNEKELFDLEETKVSEEVVE